MVNMIRILILLLLLAMFIVPVSADGNVSVSGTVSYSYSQSNSYGISPSVWYGVVVPTRIAHRFTDAKYLDSLYASGIYKRSSGVEYTINDYTTFSATVDGIFYGSGIVGMIEESTSNVCFDLVFTTINSSLADSLTGFHLIYLTYDTSILSDVTIKQVSGPINLGAPSSSLTSSNPTGLGISQNSDIYAYGATYLSSWYNSYENGYNYFYNNITGLSNVDLSKGSSSSKWNIHNISGGSYFYESSYNVNDIDQSFIRGEQVHANVTFNVDGGVYVNTVLDLGGYTESASEGGSSSFDYNITAELDEYAPGDIVNVTYSTDIAGSIQVVDTVTDQVFHSKSFGSGAINGTWQYYISEVEDFGFFDVYLLDSNDAVLDSYRYILLPQDALESYLHIVQSSVNLYEEININVQTANASIFTIENPDGVEVWNDSTFEGQEFRGITFTPTVNPGVYTAYLYDDVTLTDTIIVYSADTPPITDPGTDPDTNETIIEDIIEDDQTMTEYFEAKFRDFAPTAWGIFLLSIVLWFMSILVSFGGSGGKRR